MKAQELLTQVLILIEDYLRLNQMKKETSNNSKFNLASFLLMSNIQDPRSSAKIITSIKKII